MITHDNRIKLFSVTIEDCRVDTFTVSGAGGQHRDRTNSGVRITHGASGATAQATDSRSQLKNKRAAFLRMVDTPLFKYWIATETRRLEGKPSAEEWAASEVNDAEKVRVEVKDTEGRWTPDGAQPELPAPKHGRSGRHLTR
jgi:protein subunit release factor A